MIPLILALFLAVGQAASPHWYESPGWILIIITGITAVFICWQAYETRRAANALMASERAWIEGYVTEKKIVGVKRYALSATNKGKTPAKILHYEVWHGQTRDNAKLSKRDFKSFSEDIYAFVGSGEDRELRNDFDMDEIFSGTQSDIANSEGVPKGAFWVEVTYIALADGKWMWIPKKRATSFVYLYDLQFGTIRREPKYNEYT